MISVESSPRPDAPAQEGRGEATPAAAPEPSGPVVPPYRQSSPEFYVPSGEVLPFGVPLCFGTPSDWGTAGRSPLVPWHWNVLSDAKWGEEDMSNSSSIAS